MLPTLKALQPKVFKDVMARVEDPAPLTSPVVVRSNNGHVIVNRFLGSGTWSKTSNNSFVIVFAWNGGCGGGSGSRGLTGGGGIGSGGAGGAPGNAMMLMLPSYYFGTTTTITVGAGGAGGSTQASAGSNGFTGSVGGTSSIGSITIPQTGTGGGGGGTSAPRALGGRGGMNTYIMSGGYTIPSSQQTGGDAVSSAFGTFAYNPTNSVIGSGTVRMPCLPFMVSTGGGGGMSSSSILAGGTPGGDIELFGLPITYGGVGSPGSPIGGPIPLDQAGAGVYFSYPWGGNQQNNQAMMFVTGGTGGGGANIGTASSAGWNMAGGPGGIGAGGGGGSAASGNGAPSSSGPGGVGGAGLVLIYEFI